MNCYVNIRNVKIITRSCNKILKIYHSDELTTGRLTADVLTTIDFHFGQQANNTCIGTINHL